jgi:GAF domain-containing protein
MTPEDWRRVSGIFHDALAQPSEQRAAFVANACADATELRTEVDRLLFAHENAGAFGEQPLQEPPVDAVVASAPRRSTLFVTVIWLFAAFTLAWFAYSTRLLIQRGGVATQLGWVSMQRTGQWYVSDLVANTDAARLLESGDHLLRMNGAAPQVNAGFWFQTHPLLPGDSYQLEFERAGERHVVTLVAGAKSNTSELVYFAIAFVWCAVGLFIGFARPDFAPARLASLSLGLTGLMLLQLGIIQGGPLWQPLHAVLGFHALARFPTGAPTRGLTRAILIFCYVVGGYAAAVGLSTQAVLFTRGPDAAIHWLTTATPLYKLRWPAVLAPFAVALVGMIPVLWRNYRRVSDEQQRHRIRWVVAGFSLAVLPQAWLMVQVVLAQFFHAVPLPHDFLPAIVCGVLIPITTAYAIVRHRVLDIRVVIRRGMQYLLARRALQVAVALPFVALVYIGIKNPDLTIGALLVQTSGPLIWIAVAVLALYYRQPLENWIDRRFFREQYDREQLTMKLLDESRRVDSLSGLSVLLNETMASALHPAHAYLWYRDPREHADVSASSPMLSARDLPADDRWVSWLEHQSTATMLPEVRSASLSPESVRWLERHGIDLVVPMADSGDRLIGALLLGAKRSEEPYSDGDSRFLHTLARQAAVIRENLALRARLSEEVRVRHDVLARLDQLPDLLKECPTCGACYDGGVDSCAVDGAGLMPTLPIARNVDGRYRLDRLIGKGGMGAVYEARDLRLQRTVALKIMLGRAFGQPGALSRFRREARAAARLSHPSIVTVYDVGVLTGEGAYIVMERVAGETLRAALDREHRFSPSVAAEWFAPLLDGIGAAHAQGIVHRDLKPENVMGHRVNGLLRVKILDLGLVKLRESNAESMATRTAEGLIMGTPDYMPPEQLLGREVDERADIFSIGVMLLEALSGVRPRIHDKRDAIPAFPDVPLQVLIRSCLASDAGERPASAASLAEKLLPLLRNHAQRHPIV